jgi:hypothetical protein
LATIPGCSHTVEVACVVDVQPPKLASFVPAIVR